MTERPTAQRGGLFDGVRAVLGDVVALAHTRLELASTELEIALGRLASIVLWSAVALCAGILTLLLLALTIVIAFWDEHRLLAAILVTAGAAALALTAGLVARRYAKRGGVLFADTIAEFGRDTAALERRP